MKQSYDVALVLGSGITEDGNIPESARARTRKALELYNSSQIQNIIFSGKWSYRINYIPPLTEAEAMGIYAKSIGLEESAIILEKESNSTVSNFYKIKQILKKNNLRKIILIVNEPYVERTTFNAHKVFGADYEIKVILADFQFDPEKLKSLKELESKRIQEAKRFLNQFKDGDDETIYKEAIKDLRENYLNK